MDHTMLARVYSLVAAMEAIKADIKGMEAYNIYSMYTAEYIAYNEPQFNEKAQQLNGISSELQNLGH